MEPEPTGTSIRLLGAEALERLRSRDPALLVIDVRRRAAFLERARGIPGAVPLLLDDDPLRIPDTARERPVVVYCCCRGATSSSRVARWLVRAGYRDVAVLEGGFDAWADAQSPLAPISIEKSQQQLSWETYTLAPDGPSRDEPMARLDDPFLSLLVGQGLRDLPQRRDMTILFVDMVESTRLLATHSTEEVLELVQAFMEEVVELGSLYCGDVHDFEGDGALLYFAGVGEALPAAFELRDRLLARRRQLPALPLPRISLDTGPLVVGVVGGRFRRGVALVGPCVPRAARILKLAPPGGIIATEAVVNLAGTTSPDLVSLFHRFESTPALKGMESDTPSLYLVPPVP